MTQCHIHQMKIILELEVQTFVQLSTQKLYTTPGDLFLGELLPCIQAYNIHPDNICSVINLETVDTTPGDLLMGELLLCIQAYNIHPDDFCSVINSETVVPIMSQHLASEY